MSSSASIRPLPKAPPSSLIWVMRSIISMLGSGRRPFSEPNMSPMAQVISWSRWNDSIIEGILETPGRA
ncbi:hypothetical protein D3C83_50950 [compost metagenome]